MKILLIGAGFWGAKVLNTLQKFEDIYIKVYDTNPNVLEELKNKNISIISDIDKELLEEDINSIFIITPPHTHFNLAKKALSHNKNVFIEKPMTMNYEEAIELKEFAKKQNKILHTDNTFIYTPEINFIKQMINFDFIGKITNFESTRSNWGPFKKDIDVVWDLMPHDISILNYILPKQYVLKGVSATGSTQINQGVIEKARATLFYSNEFTAYIEASFLSAQKIRRISINGTSGIFYNDSANENSKLIIKKLHESEKHYNSQSFSDPLYLEINHFFESIRQNKNTLSGSEESSIIIKILEKISESINNHGEYVQINN